MAIEPRPMIRRSASQVTIVASVTSRFMTISALKRCGYGFSARRCAAPRSDKPSHPRHAGFVFLLERRDLVFLAEREAHFVRAGEQAFLAERIDREIVGRAVRRRDGLRLQIDHDMRTRGCLEQPAQCRANLERLDDRQETVLEAVVEEDVAEARRDHGAEAVIVKRPHRMLARGAAAEVAVADQDFRRAIFGAVEHELRLLAAVVVEAQVVEQQRTPAVLAVAPEKARRDDLVGIDVRRAQRHRHVIEAPERLHDQCPIMVRTSVSLPLTAAATAITGLTRCVRAPLPWRPTKLRFEVEAQRSPGATRSPFMPTLIEQPASRQSKQARRKIASRPSASACAFTRPEPGTTIDGTMVLRPSARCAAARKSSIRLLVQEPMNTRSTAISDSNMPGRRSM